MAKKKSKKKSKKLPKVLIFILFVVILIVVGVFAFFYYEADKKLEEVEVDYKSIGVEDGTVSFTTKVNGDIDEYEIYAMKDGVKYIIVESSKKFNESILYSKKLDAGEYTIYVEFFTPIVGGYNVYKTIKLSTITIKRDITEAANGVKYEDFQIQFLELGNTSAGDSIYIKAGDTDILIDAGSEKGSATTLETQIDEYCTDKRLEYVIATHGDQDHIAAMVGSKTNGAYNGILYYYDVDNIIYNEQTSKTSNIYSEFITAADNAVSNGAKRTYAHEFFNSDQTPKDSATIKLSDYVSMTILWNKYYFEKGYTTASVPSGWENNYSVCTLFTYTRNDETHNFLLTGDLEYEGEEALVNHYDGSTDALTLPSVDLFKGGHHGSATSSNDFLLEKITPSIVCVCSCCGTNEYTTDYSTQFITQAFINRVAKYTDSVYCTSTINPETKEVESMNGKITVSAGLDKSGKVQIGLDATNNLTKLKDTTWFNETIYVLDYTIDSKTGIPSGNNSAKKGSNEFYNDKTEGVKAVPRRIWPTS